MLENKILNDNLNSINLSEKEIFFLEKFKIGDRVKYFSDDNSNEIQSGEIRHIKINDINDECSDNLTVSILDDKLLTNVRVSNIQSILFEAEDFR